MDGWHKGHHLFNVNREVEQLEWNLAKCPSRMKRIDIEDEIWSRVIKLSLDKDQGYEFLQKQERDHVILWVSRSDGAYSFYMVPK